VNKARPVEINGVTYPSNKAAARALGISPATLVRRIRGGLARYADGKPVRPIASGSWRPPRPDWAWLADFLADGVLALRRSDVIFMGEQPVLGVDPSS
jgi:hypothetical protein